MCDNGIDFMGKLRQKFKIKPMCFYRRSDLESDISNHMWHITHIREVNALITQMIDFFLHIQFELQVRISQKMNESDF